MIVVKATFKFSTPSTKSCGDHWHCIKTQTFASVFRYHCSSTDMYRFGQKWLKVVIKNFRDTFLYECVSLIFSHLSCICHLVCDTSFRHIQSLMHSYTKSYVLSLGKSRHTHTHTQKRERDRELNSAPHGPSNELIALRVSTTKAFKWLVRPSTHRKRLHISRYFLKAETQ